MSTFVAISSVKGGASKTATAVCLGFAARAAGRDAVVLDLDPQGTAARWAPDMVVVPSPADPAVGLTVEDLVLAAADHDLVLIDTPPGAHPHAAVAVDAADLVVTPTALGAGDVEALAAQAGWTQVDLVVPTRCDGRKYLHHAAVEHLQSTYGDLVTQAVPASAEVEYAQVEHRGLAPLSPPAVAYRLVLERLLALEANLTVSKGA